jgi:hypothetical protein
MNKPKAHLVGRGGPSVRNHACPARARAAPPTFGPEFTDHPERGKAQWARSPGANRQMENVSIPSFGVVERKREGSGSAEDGARDIHGRHGPRSGCGAAAVKSHVDHLRRAEGKGRVLAKLHKNVVVKVPLLIDGLKAVRTLKQEGIRTNVTLCFSVPQALLASKAGAAYISPFLGRLDDIGSEGIELVKQIVTIYANYHLETEVLAASIRSPFKSCKRPRSGPIAPHCPLP